MGQEEPPTHHQTRNLCCVTQQHQKHQVVGHSNYVLTGSTCSAYLVVQSIVTTLQSCQLYAGRKHS